MATSNESERHVLVELKHSEAIFASALTLDGSPTEPMSKDLLSAIPSCHLDEEFGAVEVPAMLMPDLGEAMSIDPYDLNMGETVNEAHEANTFLARATVPDSQIKACLLYTSDAADE